MVKIQMTIEQLQSLLFQQKIKTIEKCLTQTYFYNSESTESSLKNLPIDEAKFREHGLSAEYPQDFVVLKKYLSND